MNGQLHGSRREDPKILQAIAQSTTMLTADIVITTDCWKAEPGAEDIVQRAILAAAGAAQGAVQGGQARPATPTPATPTPTPAPVTAPGAGASFLFDPGTIAQAKGATFTVNILISGAQNVYSVPLQLNYDPSKLQLMNVSNGGFLSQDGQTVALVHREDEASGTLQITATRPPNTGGVSGQGSVVTLTFMAKASGQSPLTITRGGARDPAMQPITVNGAQAVVTIQ